MAAASIDELLVGFAQEHAPILAVYEGIEQDEGSPIYYLLTGPRAYDGELEDKVTHLDVRLLRAGAEGTAMTWPIRPTDVNGSHPYLKRKIWERYKTMHASQS